MVDEVRAEEVDALLLGVQGRAVALFQMVASGANGLDAREQARFVVDELHELAAVVGRPFEPHHMRHVGEVLALVGGELKRQAAERQGLPETVDL